MLHEILEEFINKVGEQQFVLTPKEKEFLQHLVKLPQKDKNLILAPNSDEFEAFKNIVGWGFEEAIITIAEKITGFTFKSLEDVERNDNIDNLARSQSLSSIGVFSTLIENKATFFISNANQIEAIKNNCDIDEFDVFLSWPWEIFNKNKSAGLTIQNVSGQNKHIIMATGQMQIDTVAKYFNGFTVDTIVEYRKDLIRECKHFQPDILVVSDNVGGNEELVSILIKIKSSLPKTRIIYFTSELAPKDEVRKHLISVLISLGVYDIMFDNKFSIDMLKYLLGNPNPYSAVKNLVIKASNSSKVKRKEIELISSEDEGGSLLLHSQANVYSIISSKGGTGKTFIAGNIAKAIGKFGIPKDGKKVRVGIIDGDFYGGGLTNLFNVSDKKKNILTAINEVSKIMIGERMTEDDVAKHLAFEKIRECFVPLKECNNIEILGAYPEQLTEEQFDSIKGEYIQVILESVLDDFDAIIVDITGDFELKVWFPVFTLSRHIFSIVEMEYNSVASCLKQKAIISDFIGNKSKLQYIFNKTVDNDIVLWDIDQISKDASLTVSGDIPYIDRTYMINNAFEGKWLVDTDNEDDYDIKYRFLKIANIIWPIKDLKEHKKAAKIEKEEEHHDPMKMPKSFKELIEVGSKVLFPFAGEAEKKLLMRSGLSAHGKKKKAEEIVEENSENTENNVENTEEGGIIDG